MKLNLLSMTLLSSACLVLLSACGGDDKTTSNNDNGAGSGGSYDTPAEIATFPSQVALPAMTLVNESGSLLLAESGLSLYTFDNDSAGVSTCRGAPDAAESCAGRWPPLLVADGAVASANLSVITRDDGEMQWAYNQQALYTFAQDSAQGDVLGDGIGNIWHLARPMPIKTAMINDLESYVGNQTVLSATQSSDVLTAARANKEGFTLYTFDMDVTNSSACMGACIDAWPPLLADAGAQAQAPLSIVALSDDLSQWAYKGKPLYFFVGDQTAGANEGDEANDIWHTATLEPAIQRTNINGRFLSATGMVNVLLPNEGSTTEFSVMNKDMDGYALYTFDRDTQDLLYLYRYR